MRALGTTVVLALLGTCPLFMGLSGCSSGSGGSNGGGGGGGAISVTVSPGTAQTVDQAQAVNFTATVMNDTKSAGVTWSQTGAGSLSNFTATSVTYTAPASVTAPSSATVTATSNTDGTKSASVTVMLVTPPAISTTTVPSGNVSLAYSVAIMTSGGVPPLTFSLINGTTLPTGLTLNAATGVISGTPTATVTTTFMVQVADAGNPPLTATQSYTLVIAPAIVVTFVTPPPASRVEGQTATVIASVVNDLNKRGVDWNLSCGGGGCGTITAHTASGVGAAFVAPPTIPPAPVTIAASSTMDPGKTAAASVTIKPAGPLSITFTQPPPNMLMDGASAVIVADVANDPNNLGVDWTLACTPGTGGDCGSITAHTATDAPATYTAPTVFPTGPVTVTATSTAQNTHSVSGNVNVIPTTASACALNGQYAFALSGWDASGAVGMAGEFTVDATGHVTGGIEDVNRFQGGTSIATAITGGGCTTHLDNRGALQLLTASGSTVYNFALMANGNAKVIEADPTDANLSIVSGVIKLQDPSAFSLGSLAGDYAVALRGCIVAGASAPPCTGSNALGTIGHVTQAADGTFSSSTLDFSQQGASDTASLAAGSSFAAPDPLAGRGTGVEIFTAFGATQTSNFAYYVVNANEVFLLSTDAATSSNYFLAGEQIRQTGAGTFGNGSANGGMVFSLTGFDSSTSSSGTDISVGQAIGDGNGNLAVEEDENDAGVITAMTTTGTYTINADGTGSAAIITATTRNYSLVMITQNTGVLLEGTKTSPSSNLQIGMLDAQSGAPFTLASTAGTFAGAVVAPGSPAVTVGSGEFTLDGAGNVTGTQDTTMVAGGSITVGTKPFAATYSLDPSDPTGTRVLIVINSGNGGSGTAYIISPTKIAAVFTTDSGDQTAAVNVFEQ